MPLPGLPTAPPPPQPLQPTPRNNMTFFRPRSLAGALAATALLAAPAQAAWEPSKPIEFVVPAGTGGGADQMARFIQGMVAKRC